MASVRVAKNKLTTPTQQSRFELGVCMAIYNWEALAVSVQSFWGGPDSADKRDWMVGSIVELYEQQEQVDAEDIEDRLLQIMEDEFEVAVEDDSAYDVAEKIVRIFGQCKEGDFSLVDSLYQKHQSKSNSSSAPVHVVEQEEVSGDEME
ncbi:Pre-rRNA-processing protein TSR2-domain-containing protein [Lipomyces tetrasporus]|uniref:Pre-rRNA-processing protein TSR2-domain-containing protein n=1 Tax=Lipomyces tetrasporus TaxID=54092 RepID=A0AAD7QN03_9ASCO|nr:Pre-rRNA-processing protein TSR2-domain-containing protein [Lipomyces tetrasporus]KAJ8098352.1 Pre-rRNA-processing protein TSR2-domain-containing protein [Lipomyces tetrasporus]